MNLKQYVVVQFPDCDPKIWPRERWLDYLSNTANPGIGRVITTFDAGEELKEGATVADYEEVIQDHKRLVRDIDVILNGEEAAEQASLCDLVGQIKELKEIVVAAAVKKLLEDGGKEGGGMRWVKASERLPNHHFPVIVRGGNYVAYAHKNYDTDNPQMYVVIINQSFLTNNLEWLDEYAAQFAGTRDEWISVRGDVPLPDFDEPVLWYTESGNQFVDALDKDEWYMDFVTRHTVTHWRPLPNSPNTNILKPI